MLGGIIFFTGYLLVFIKPYKYSPESVRICLFLIFLQKTLKQLLVNDIRISCGMLSGLPHSPSGTILCGCTLRPWLDPHKNQPPDFRLFNRPKFVDLYAGTYDNEVKL